MPVKNKLPLLAALIVLGISFAIIGPNKTASAAACTLPSTDYGTATIDVDIPASGSYKIWSRIKADSSDTNNNSYLLEIDGNTCLTVGDNSAISGSSWTWVDYVGGNTSSKATHDFASPGTYSIKMIGREANVSLDRVIFTQDMDCVPTGVGDNCADPPDTDPPVVSIASPSEGTVSGSVSVSANASDADSGVQKVEFYVDGNKVHEDTSSPYLYNWDTTEVANGSHTLTASATDTAGNSATSTAVSVNVQNESNEDPGYLDEDINQDGTVNLLDFSLLAAKFGESGSSLGEEDINNDGTVNLLDFSLLAAKFGESST